MTTTEAPFPAQPAKPRCPSHPAYESDYCPLCGTAQTIARTVWA